MGWSWHLAYMFMTLVFTQIMFFIVVAHVVSLLWQLKVSIDLQWGKWKSAFISVLLQIFWQKFYKNVPGVVFYQPYEFCQKHWVWLVAMPTKRLNFGGKKNLLLRSHKGNEAETLHKCLCYYPLHKFCFLLLLYMCFHSMDFSWEKWK